MERIISKMKMSKKCTKTHPGMPEGHVLFGVQRTLILTGLFPDFKMAVSFSKIAAIFSAMFSNFKMAAI